MAKATTTVVKPVVTRGYGKLVGLTFLAILSPAKAKGPFLVDCYDQEPWRSLRR